MGTDFLCSGSQRNIQDREFQTDFGCTSCFTMVANMWEHGLSLFFTCHSPERLSITSWAPMSTRTLLFVGIGSCSKFPVCLLWSSHTRLLLWCHLDMASGFLIGRRKVNQSPTESLTSQSWAIEHDTQIAILSPQIFYLGVYHRPSLSCIGHGRQRSTFGWEYL